MSEKMFNVILSLGLYGYFAEKKILNFKFNQLIDHFMTKFNFRVILRQMTLKFIKIKPPMPIPFDFLPPIDTHKIGKNPEISAS